MKLHKSQRSAQAERICRAWIRRRKLRLKVPKVYVIRRTTGGGWVWGRYHWSGDYITMHLGHTSILRDWYLLLAHEFSHFLVRHTTARRYRTSSHGERFQRILWGVVPRGLWVRASNGQWAIGASAHKPQFQPDRKQLHIPSSGVYSVP